MVPKVLVDERLWRKRKEEFLRRLLEDEEIGYLDNDIKDVLMMFFSMDGAFTMSSCSGRIALVDAPMPWLRDRSSVVFKKHDTVSTDEVRGILRSPVMWRLWLVVTGPIIHVSALDMETAKKVLEIGRAAGFKHSGILSMSNKGITVELVSGVGMTVLLREGSKYVVDPGEGLEVLVRVANEALREGKKRLERLREVLHRRVSC